MKPFRADPARILMACVGVNEYQTVPPVNGRQDGNGSPGSIVALEASTMSLYGTALITLADAKLSLLGVAAVAVPAPRPTIDKAMARNAPSIARLRDRLVTDKDIALPPWHC